MKVEFNKLPDNARVWVYTSHSKINPDQRSIILSLADDFLDQWESHGKSVHGSITVINDYFVLIAADDKGNPLCGRAVDENVSFIKSLQDKIGLDLMSRMSVAVKLQDEIKILDYNNIKAQIDNGNITNEAIVFNPLVKSKQEFLSSFQQNISNSWLS